MRLAPTKEQNRIEHIDIMRGFAIFGIFMVNIGAFSAPYFMHGGWEAVWDTPLERFIQAFIDIFFQGSFYTLFSILFGFSWQLMKARLQVKGMATTPFLFQRQLGLIGFGLIHAFLIWHGDILLSYGLIGLFLLLFIEVKERTLLVWAAVLLFGSVAFITPGLYAVRDLLNNSDSAAINQAIDNYSSNELLLIWKQNFQDWALANSSVGFIFLIMTLLPLFLLGMYLARKRVFHEPEIDQPILKWLLIISFLLSLILKAGPYLIGNPLWFTYVQDNLGGTASALFYMTMITLLAQTALGGKLIRPLRYVGRTALSNYIFQSLISFILFYGIGFGLYGSVAPSVSVFIVVVIFSLQVLASKWWLSRYRFGPLEWVWRSLNYKEIQRLRK
ncbi:DUF418 domain-containing protein [Oceanobacillus alkalisoli]|uniref:DUF418 domain-containing protein n=1 Tax=Oceanobacillus alkalisoli TaxID=2925113 RepID=UPI001EE4A5C1|nr:DUF418 domain-containing protein [Oceanobacillus alkalisoli]MCG5101995.1 DUF418 domain-containing protein [Oceanobacillus alkalisoli]